jgi:hypothetical protein
LASLKNVKIVKFEDRPKDAWVDMSLRQLREGEVRFYRVKDFLTGEWLFKVCPDEELGKVLVKALKCPPGKRFAQLEGDTMLFQRSIAEGWLYDVISLAYVDDEERIRRKIVQNMEEIPSAIRENFEVKAYEEAAGKKAPGKNLVTLTRQGDEKAMITLFLLERAWPVSPVSPEVELKTVNLLDTIEELEKARIEDIYRTANQRFGIRKEDVDAILASLEKRGRIKRPGAEYVKVIG